MYWGIQVPNAAKQEDLRMLYAVLLPWFKLLPWAMSVVEAMPRLQGHVGKDD